MRKVAEALFEYRADLVRPKKPAKQSNGDGRSRQTTQEEALPFARRIRERYEPGGSFLPYHPGAIEYYERRRPSFLAEHSEAISLGLTVLFACGSAALAVRERLRRRRKNRIDKYYGELPDVSSAVHEAPPEQLIQKRVQLDEIRHWAFRDLIEEQVEADESFVIFQDFLRGELAAVDARLNALVAAGSGRSVP